MARRSKLCWAVLAAFLFAYILAFAYAVIGVRGMFGFTPDDLSVIWLIFLGMPWTLVLAIAPDGAMPELVARAFVAVAPFFNLWLMYLTCRKRRRRRS